MAAAVRLSFPAPAAVSRIHSPACLISNPKSFLLGFRNRPIQPLRASRRTPNFPQGAGDLVDDPRYWSRSIMPEYEEDDESDEEEEEERSFDLLIKFVQNVYRKISRRARKAVRSVLPVSIPSQLVGFSVDGVLILAFLWILKAFLGVVCTIGSAVFVSILLIRGIWTGLAYLQGMHNDKTNRADDDPRTWNGAQPAG